MRISFVNPKDVAAATSPRSLFGSKKNNGRIAVIAGSSEYHGAAALSSNAVYSTLAALRVGIGYAYLYVPASIINPIRALSPSIIVRRFGGYYISSGNLQVLKKQLVNVDTVVIGMGLGRNPGTIKMAAKIIDYAVRAGKKVVIDADALYSVRYTDSLNFNVVLTPQDSEFNELSGHVPGVRSLDERITFSVALSRKLGCCILLKGHNTVITDGKRLKVVKSRSSALATMGSGDVLSGIIGGYMAAGADSFKAAAAGAYVHSRLGDMLYSRMGNHIISSDLVDAIPDALKKFDKGL